jgi:glycosyltransferase involved in cell wall biosynthesis
MKNLLIIAPYFVPRRRVGALRPFRFASHLAVSGWNISVVTIGSGEMPTPEEKKSLEKMNILEISPPFDRTKNSGEIAAVAGNSKSNNKKSTLMDKSGNLIDRHTPLDTWIYLFRLRYGKIRTFAAKQNPDAVWATGDPWSGLWLGEKLSGDLNIPFVADFRDPWTLSGLNLRDRSAWSESADRRFEERILRHASKVIFTSGATAELYKRHYHLPSWKVKVICNSYSDLIEHKTLPTSETIRFENDHFHILFLGRFRRLSPATAIINVLERLYEKDTQTASKIRIHSFGKMWDEDIQRVKKAGIKKIFKMHKPVNPQHIGSVLENADLLMVSTAPERDTIIPAKFWEYLSVGKPVLAISRNEEIRGILSKAGGGVFFRPDQVEETADFISRMMISKENRTVFPVPEINVEERKKFGSGETSRQLGQTLEEVIAHGRR